MVEPKIVTECEERDEFGFCRAYLFGECEPYEINGCTLRDALTKALGE